MGKSFFNSRSVTQTITEWWIIAELTQNGKFIYFDTKLVWETNSVSNQNFSYVTEFIAY